MKLKEIFWASMGRMEFVLHCRFRSIALYLLLSVVVCLLGFKYRVAGYASLMAIVLLWRFYYLAFVDKRRRVYADDYQPNAVDRASYGMSAVLVTGLLLIVFLCQLIAPESLRCGF